MEKDPNTADGREARQAHLLPACLALVYHSVWGMRAAARPPRGAKLTQGGAAEPRSKYELAGDPIGPPPPSATQGHAELRKPDACRPGRHYINMHCSIVFGRCIDSAIKLKCL